MNCDQIRELLDKLMDSALSLEEEKALEQHTRTCHACRREMTAALNLKRQDLTLSPKELPMEFAQNVLREATSRNFNKPKRLIVRIAALVFISLALVFCLNLLEPKIALADILTRIQNAKTMKYYFKMDLTKGKLNTTCFYRVPGLFRREQVNGTILIQDSLKRKLLLLNHKRKTATLMDLKTAHPEPFVEKLKQIILGEQQVLGQEQLDGVASVLYQTKGHEYETKIWVEKKSTNILKIQSKVKDGVMTWSGFEFDLELPPSLFSLKPPDDYQLVHKKAPSPPEKKMGQVVTEEDFIFGLKQFGVDKNGFFLPESRLTPKEPLTSMGIGEQILAGPDEAKIRFYVMLLNLQQNPTWSYVGAGVKFMDKTKPLCWYKKEGETFFRVIFGDLSVKEMEIEK